MAGYREYWDSDEYGFFPIVVPLDEQIRERVWIIP